MTAELRHDAPPPRAAAILDLSRLLSRARHRTPSGVDRVEMAYARGLQQRYGDRLSFAAVHPFGPYGRLPKARTLRFLDQLEHRWANEDAQPGVRPWRAVIPSLATLLPTPSPRRGRHVYVQASPHHLTDTALVRRILARENARFVCLVHDLIPIEYPEYARPTGAAEHRRRIATVTTLADGIIVNSVATGEALAPWLAQSGRTADVRVALLGTHEMGDRSAIAPQSGPGFFLCVGTIEPRKNHLLLLNLWRQMVETLPRGTTPRLVIVGRRGWENEQIVDMLERCRALGGVVEELNACSDRRMHELLVDARALLMPSFAEGYGMPVAEALLVGTPVICSDLPALREAGGTVPDFLDPLDGPAWRRLILDYAAGGPARVAQLARMTSWRAPSWKEHIQIVFRMIEDAAI